ncbi:MAG: M48 family metallopeptidase [Acidobacteriia bacterium]|nr:M48 family metallopeptidase [Terriglobia bacterium]
MPTDQEIKRYTRLRRILGILNFSISAVLLLVLLFGHLSIWVRSQVEDRAADSFLIVLGYLIVVGMAGEILTLPLSFLSGYWVEHRFNLSNQTFWSWVWDHVKGLILSGVLALAAAELVYFTLRRAPESWWMWCAAAFTAFGVLLAQLAPVLIFPLFFKFEPLENENLKQRLLALCDRLKTRVRGVYNWKLSEKSNKANAAVMGWGRTRRIVLADTLLKDFSEDEIEVILAHELGHHVHHDVWKGIGLQTASTWAVFYLIRWSLEHWSRALGFRSAADVANLPFLLLVSTLFSLLAMPLVNGYSRRLERSADGFALDQTSKIDAFISSMRKLGEKNLSENQPNRFIEFVFHSHPSIARRIAAAQARR